MVLYSLLRSNFPWNFYKVTVTNNKLTQTRFELTRIFSAHCFQLKIRRLFGFRFLPAEFYHPVFSCQFPEISDFTLATLSKCIELLSRFTPITTND